MNAALRALYRSAGGLVTALAAVTPAGTRKWTRSLHARRGIRARYAAFASTRRDPARPLLWVHAPSVGEGLQARPVLSLLRRAHPDWQTAYTHFSPSAEAFARDLGTDFVDYLLFDTPGDARCALDALRPTALIFTKLDVWPILVEGASDRGVPLGLISATLSASSSRRSGIARALLRDAYARLDAIGAIDAGDAERLVALGVRADRIRVTGDTRYDQVWERAAKTSRQSPLLAPLSGGGRPTVVAGSTWPADEDELLPAWTEVRRRVPGVRLVIAPHEPGEGHLAPIERRARDAGWRLARLGAADAAAADIVLVDRVGVLGELYALARVAYVGGGFHDAGLHSVLEPAAFGAPVIFGPRHAASRDAALLVAAGGGESVPDRAALAATLTGWLTDDDACREAGTAARRLVERGLGAARRNADLIEGLMRAG